MRTIPNWRLRLALTLISSLVWLSLSSCSGSSSPTATSSSSGSSGTAPTPVSFASATTTFQQNMIAETPHFTNSSVVTAVNLQHYFPKHWGSIFSEAVAAELGLAVIWDPESGSAPAGSDFSVLNLYNGGGFTCSGASNTCTLGSVTIQAQESLKNFMGQALDPNFLNSNGASTTLFGRLKQASTIVCALGNLLPAAQIDTDGLPIVGSLTLSFPAATTNIIYQPISAGGCSAPTDQAGASLPLTVTAVTSANYAKQIIIAPLSVIAWLKLDTTAGSLNVMTLEDQRNNGRYAVDRAIANITGINTPGSGKTLFEYISIGSNVAGSTNCYANGGWQCSYEYHRVFIDEAANGAYLVSNFGSPGDQSGGIGTPTSFLQYTAVARPSDLKTCTSGGTCSGSLALSFTANGQQEVNSNIVYPSVGNDYEGCVNLLDRSLASSGALTCSITGTSILASGGASAMIESTRQVYATDVVATLLAHTSATTTLSFTGATDIFTAPNTN
ncbi:hypothetical protein [Solimicrobium silvestre]|uniref:Uncharacterized protein n=1 Tax=Solimicrobium silvestre TaxID=2099400 RepID=A0A2S9GSM4_9BURK|nr:hypothetical protein [Solimicrobium silvestre]PRC90710.1 hypothetical protein S2091_4603 [Solimicrobium silvestre]